MITNHHNSIALRLIASCAIVIFFIACLAQSSDPDRGRRILRETAARADAGDAEALYQMSVVYSRGFDSIPADLSKSDSLLRLSAESGHPVAANMLAFRLMEGKDIPADTMQAVKWFEVAANAGDAKAQSNLGYILVNGIGVSPDSQRGAYWLELASENGITRAQSMLGDLYRDGNGVARDSMQADAHYRAAFEKGLVDAGYKLADLRRAYTDTIPDDRLLAEALYFYRYGASSPAIKWLSRLENSNDIVVRAHAMAVLGDAYARAQGVAYDYEKSIDYLFKAATQGNPSAAFMIAELLDILPDALNRLIKDNDPADLSSAQYWYEIAAPSGITNAAEAYRRLLTF